MYAAKVLDPNFKDHKVVARVYNLRVEPSLEDRENFNSLGEVSYDRDGLVIFPKGDFAESVSSKLSVFGGAL